MRIDSWREVAWGMFAVVAALPAVAAPWPSWRGPTGDQVAADGAYPLHWSWSKDGSRHVAWRAELPEPGNSSPVVWGDQVFVTQAIGDGRRRTVMCFDRGSGRLRWQQGVEFAGADPRHKTNPHCAASPVTDGERVVASFASAGIVAWDFSGRELWRADLGPQRHEWGQGSSPVIHGDLVIVYHGPGPGSALHGLDKRTGSRRWSVPLKEQHPPERFDGFAGKSDGMIGTFSTPLVVTSGGREQVVVPVVNQLRAFAPDDGRALWACEGMNPLVYSSPSFGEGLVVALGGFFGSAIHLRPEGTGDVTARRVHYTQRLKKHCIGSPVIFGGHYYVSTTDGFGQCVELASGRVVWEERLPSSGASGQTWGSMVRAGDRLYTVNQSGDTLVLRAGTKFEMLATNRVGELSNSTPAFSDGQVFLRTQSALYCLAEAKDAAR